MAKSFFIMLITLAALLLANNCSADQAFEGVKLSGLLTCLQYTSQENLDAERSSTNTFNVCIDKSGRYLMSIRDARPAGITIYMGYDGSDTYYASFIPSKGIDRKETAAASSTIDGYVSSGNYPFAPWDEKKRVQLLWLVFGAGNTLNDSHTNTLPLTWMPARWSLVPYGFKVQYDLNDNPPFIPVKLSFVRDTNLNLPSFEMELERPELDTPQNENKVASLKGDLLERTKYWRQGTVAGEAEVIVFTNYQGLTLPTSFSIKTFYSFKSRVAKAMTGVVTNIEEAPLNQSLLPPILAPLNVLDTRNRRRDESHALDSINYRVDATTPWRPHSDAQLKAQFEAGFHSDQVSHRFLASPWRRTRIWITIVFLIAALVFLVWLYKLSQRSKTSKG